MNDLLLPLGASVSACLMGFAVYFGAPLIWRDLKAWRRWRRYNSSAMKRSRYKTHRENLNWVIGDILLDDDDELYLSEDAQWELQSALYDLRQARVA